MSTIILRAAKAAPLTHNEVDANFTNLNTDKLEIGAFQLANNNTKLGLSTLASITSGGSNVAYGTNSLLANTSGAGNTGHGVNTLVSNTTGGTNTAIGFASLLSNTTGTNNVGCGGSTLFTSTTGEANTAIGAFALYASTSGSYNVAAGLNGLRYLTTGSGNIAIGSSSNTGAYAAVFDVTSQNNRIAMGSTAVTNAYVQVAWTIVSDARDKTNFAPVPHGLSFLNALKPTAYQYTENRESSTPNGPIRYGFLAQDILELEGANSVIIDAEDPEKLRYNGEALVPVLVNAVQELSAMVKALQAEVAALS